MTTIEATKFLPTVNVFLTVADYLQKHPGYIHASEIAEAVPDEFKDQFNLTRIGAEMGALYDWGKANIIGPPENRQARWLG